MRAILFILSAHCETLLQRVYVTVVLDLGGGGPDESQDNLGFHAVLGQQDGVDGAGIVLVTRDEVDEFVLESPLSRFPVFRIRDPVAQGLEPFGEGGRGIIEGRSAGDSILEGDGALSRIMNRELRLLVPTVYSLPMVGLFTFP